MIRPFCFEWRELGPWGLRALEGGKPQKKSGVKWLLKTLRVSLHHPLGFNWHPDWKVLVYILVL